MARLKVFDTNALIAVSQGSFDISSQDVHVVISVITRIEFLAWPNLDDLQRELARRMLNSVDTAPLTEEIEEEVIALRKQRTLKLPDAIIAATALVLGAPLVTNDDVFTKVSGLILETF